MNAPPASALAPWQTRALQPALSALAAGRLAHALLFAGPARLGKRAAADALAQRLLCTAPGDDGLACGGCRGCRFHLAGSHPDLLTVGLEVNEKTGNLRTEIVVDQIRRLGQWFALTPQLGGAQVAVLDPAEAMNASAANALLKTLEEPLPGRYLLLVSARPHRLVATIRSRCQRLAFRLPGDEEAKNWLVRPGRAPELAARALELARGHPGLAEQWLASGGLELRQSVIEDMDRLGEGRAAAVATAQAWLADDAIDLRLRFAAEHALEQARSRLADASGVTGLSAWFDAANRLRNLLSTPIRIDLALAGLLHEWRISSMMRTSQEARSRR